MHDVRHALEAAGTYGAATVEAVGKRVADASIDTEQRAAHGLAWVATGVAALEALSDWHGRCAPDAVNDAVLRIGVAETVAQLTGGLPMGQNEIVRPADLGTQGAASHT